MILNLEGDTERIKMQLWGLSDIQKNNKMSKIFLVWRATLDIYAGIFNESNTQDMRRGLLLWLLISSGLQSQGERAEEETG